MFIGGGIFYGLKIWQGTALGCPEPIIQDVVKNHEFGISPYHGHEGISSSYPGGPFESLGSVGGYLGGLLGGGDSTPYFNGGSSSSFSGAGPDYASVYSQTPASPSYSGPQYLPPSGSSGGVSQSLSYPATAGAGVSQDPTSQYPTNRRRRVSSTGRQISEESQTLFGDLMFRFLGVNTDECKRRFVCELEFRNPFMGYAFKYIGLVNIFIVKTFDFIFSLYRVELFKEFVTPKDGDNAPKKFTDCAKLYTECRAPNEQPTGVIKKKQLRRRNQTVTPSTIDETTVESDLVTQYVQQQRNI